MQVEKPYQSVQGMLLYLLTVGQAEEGGLSKSKLLNFGYSTHTTVRLLLYPLSGDKSKQ